jgi:flotillin
MIIFIVFGISAAVIVLTAIIAMFFRIVVATNDVHIIQSRKKSTVYGKDQASGNVYYMWPSWVPFIGVKAICLPVSNFPVKLDSYEAYDKGRLPFQVDVMAFFRIEEPVLAAQRISDFKQLNTQLEGILQGACRTILATSEIEQILEGRSEFGEKFTAEVDHNLANWGVKTVKNIEFMDIRDTKDSQVIFQIMAKKKSEIEKESRIAVASNHREAELAEVAAFQLVEVRKQEAHQMIGVRKAQAEQQVGVSNEKSKQEVAEQAATTAEKNMAVKKVNDVRQAEISREVEIVAADKEAKKQVIQAEGEKKKTVTIAEGNLEQAKLSAQGIEAEGKARGVAEQAILMAPITTQIELAKEIGANEGYQNYLVRTRAIEKEQVVGVAQAEALKDADIKVIANTSDAVSGVNNVMDLFTSKGGTHIGAAIEAFSQTPAGAAIVDKLTGSGVTKKANGQHGPIAS